MTRRKSFGSSGALNLIGPRLRDLRETADLKAIEVAKLLQKNGWDIDPVVLSMIENRRRTLTDIEIQMILRVLDRTWGDLDAH